MKSIIIAHPERASAVGLARMLEGEGYTIFAVRSHGAGVLSSAQMVNEGVVVCAEHLGDMSAGTLAELLPRGYDVLALSKNGRTDYMGNLICLSLPIHREEFLETLAVLVSTRSSFTQREKSEAQLISQAKLILMQDSGMSEGQAHRYLQKESMRMRKTISALAQEIVDEFTEQ